MEKSCRRPCVWHVASVLVTWEAIRWKAPRSCYRSYHILFRYSMSFPRWYGSYQPSNDHITVATTKSSRILLRKACCARLATRGLLREAKHVWLLSLPCSKCPPLHGAPGQRIPSHVRLLLREIHTYIAILYKAVLCTVMGSQHAKHIHIQVRELV